jgi:lysine 2,3-aminomutase
MLKKYHPLLISINFAHPKEITPECKEACRRLVELAGIPLGSQTVLLKGVNDKLCIIKELVHELLKIRIKPYYLYQADLAAGTSHFRTKVEVGIGIMEGLIGWTTGYAIPRYVIDAPGGGGKVPINPEYIIQRDSKKVIIRNYLDNIYTYTEVQ